MGWRGAKQPEERGEWLENWLRGYAESEKTSVTNGRGVLYTIKSPLDRKMTILTKEIAHELVKEQGSNIVIPDIYTSIADSAFESVVSISAGGRTRFPNLTSVIIPDSITSIGREAFAGNSLTNVVIPDSVTKFSDEQQFRDNKLTDITLSKNLKEISAGAFTRNQLRSVDIPDSVTLINDSAFQDNQLESIEIPNSVTYITNAAFLDNQLSSVKIPDSVTLIGNIAFKGNNLNSVEIPEGTTLLGGSQFDPGVRITYRERKTTSSHEETNQNQEGKQIVEIEQPSKFHKKSADKITNFNPSTDTLEIDTDSFGIDSSASFATGKNKKAVKKELAKQDFDFLYDEKKGGLYFNENGADKGFGDGGIIAILKGAPDLTSDNLDFI